MELSVEQFMDGIKAIMHKHGIDNNEDIDPILVDAYNKYRNEVKNGKTIEELIPFFYEVANNIVDSRDKDVLTS